MYILSWFVKMKNLFAKISLFQLSDSLVQPQPQGAYVISINKIGSEEQRREPHHLGIYVTAQVQVLYCEEGRREFRIVHGLNLAPINFKMMASWPVQGSSFPNTHQADRHFVQAIISIRPGKSPRGSTSIFESCCRCILNH